MVEIPRGHEELEALRVRGRVPTPWSMLRQPIHFAPGATPIWFPEPSSPIEVPVVWLPWPLSSHASRRWGPHEPPPLWIASHQL